MFNSEPDDPRRKPADRLAIVTWNVHVGAGDIGALIQELRDGEFTAGEPVNDFVLLLQEVYRRDPAIPARVARGLPVPARIESRGWRSPDVQHLSPENRLAVLYAPSMRNGSEDDGREDRGNAIVSTSALRDAMIIELPMERQRRVALAAIVEGRSQSGVGWRVRVADVHLDTALAFTRGGPFTARRRQAEALLTALSESAAAHEPPMATVVAGDFNTWMGRREPAVAAMRRVFPDGQQSDDKPTWSGSPGFHATLDHVFVGGTVKSVEVHRLPSRFGSDHYPLLALVSF